MCRVKLNYNIDWNGIFKLDINSPSGLVRVVSSHTNHVNSFGTKSFNLKTKSPHCWRIRHEGKFYQVHRIILLLHGIELSDEHVVDHIDGNPFNNKIENLRVVSQKINNQNRLKSLNKPDSVLGVCKTNNGQGRSYWTALWSENGKPKRKNFSIEDFGEVKAKNFAIKFRKDKIKELRGKGEHYTDRHGL